MRRSEKILLAILILGLLAWQGGRLVNRLLLDPIRQRQDELAQLEERIASQQKQDAELSRVETGLRRWRQRSLPPDPLTAQRLYQQWLTDLAQDCGFTSLKVFPDQVRRKSEAAVGVVVSVDAEARLGQLCLFLSRCYRTDLAQQITLLNIDSTRDHGDPPLRVTIMAEGLSLRDAPARQRLFPISTLARDLGVQESTVHVVDEIPLPETSGCWLRIGGEYMPAVAASGMQWSVKRPASGPAANSHARGESVEFIPLTSSPPEETRPAYEDLVAQNPFAKPAPPVVEQVPLVGDEAPELDPAEFTYLVGAFAEDDQHQAWLYDRLNNKTVIVSIGDPFSVAGIVGVVRSIGNGFILLQHNDSLWRLRLGKNLRSMERLADGTAKIQADLEQEGAEAAEK
jgi:hypothetical protein